MKIFTARFAVSARSQEYGLSCFIFSVRILKKERSTRWLFMCVQLVISMCLSP